MKNIWTEVKSLQKPFKKTQAWLQKFTWWEIVLWVIGGSALISILFVLFLPVGNGPAAFTVSGPVPAVSTPEFRNMLSKSLVLPLENGDDVEILNNGDEFLPRLLKDIDSARSTVDFMVYIWVDGKMSDEVLAHLSKKVKEGVAVRIMLDAFGDNGKPDDKLDDFKKLGGKVETFHSLTIAPWNIANNHTRNHRRAIVIDGIIGYTGGIAVKDTWLGHAESKEHWRDFMFRTTGSMVGYIQGAFSELWTSVSGELLTGPTFFPVTPAQAAKNSTLSYIPLASTPSANSLQLQKFIVLSLMGAQHKIYITSPYFLPDRSFKEVLMQKAKAGVDVRVLVPNNLTDAAGVRFASHYTYKELLEAGVKIYEYKPTFIHAKSIIVDGGWTVIGSANMDNRSRKINEEDVFGISSTPFGAKMEAIFLQDIARAGQINLKEWKKRSLIDRAREIFARKFVQQY